MPISPRRRQPFPTVAILVATSLGVAVASPLPAAQRAPAATAEAALDACRALLTRQVYSQAIQRCDEAVRLDAALVGLLGIDILQGGKDETALEYANQLAAEPSHGRREALVLAGVYSRHARPDLAEKYLKRQLDADPSDAEMCQILAQLYNEPVWNGRSRFDDTVGTLERCSAQSPSDATGYYKLATFLWDKAYRDAALPDREKLAYVERGLVPPMRPQPQFRRSVWAARSRSRRSSRTCASNTPSSRSRHECRGSSSSSAPSASRGNVVDTKILRSIPLLDEAALAAVRQWSYERTLFNGVPVPLIMTVTVSFTLS